MNEKSTKLFLHSGGILLALSTMKGSRWAEIHERRDGFLLQLERAPHLLLSPGGTNLDRMRSLDRREPVFCKKQFSAPDRWGHQSL